MNPELTKKLNKDFSFLKGYYGKGVPIDCGDGWYELLRECLTTISLAMIANPDRQIVDIKEKWGRLSIYLSQGNDFIYDTIEEYSERSAHVCENCGKESSIKSFNGWYSTICTKCLRDRGE